MTRTAPTARQKRASATAYKGRNRRPVGMKMEKHEHSMTVAIRTMRPGSLRYRQQCTGCPKMTPWLRRFDVAQQTRAIAKVRPVKTAEETQAALLQTYHEMYDRMRVKDLRAECERWQIATRSDWRKNDYVETLIARRMNAPRALLFADAGSNTETQ